MRMKMTRPVFVSMIFVVVVSDIIGVFANPLLADLNWQSADLTNEALLDVFEKAYYDTGMQVGTTYQFSSSAAALQGLTDNQAHVFAECWNDTDSHCDRTPDTTWHETGIIGTTDLYVPRYVTDKFGIRELDDLENELNLPVGFEILGGVESWSEKDSLEDFLTNYCASEPCSPNPLAYLLPKVQFFSTASALNSAILSGLRDGSTPFVFLSWEPDPITNIHLGEEIEKLTEDSQGTDVVASWRNYFPSTNILFVRRNDVPAYYEQRFPDFQLTNDDSGFLIDQFADRASLQLDSTSLAYTEAVQAAADAWSCNRTAEVVSGGAYNSTASVWTLLPASAASTANDACQSAAALSRWPRTKNPLFPDKLVVWTKICPPFVMPPDGHDKSFCDDWKTLAENSDTQGHTGLQGYSIDHLKDTAAMLGYAAQDIIIRCGPSTPWVVERASQELAHLSHSCITITDDRMSLVDFSSPFFSTGYQLLVRDLTREKQATAVGTDATIFLKPFTSTAWYTLILLCVLVATTLGILEWSKRNGDPDAVNQFSDQDSHANPFGVEGKGGSKTENTIKFGIVKLMDSFAAVIFRETTLYDRLNTNAGMIFAHLASFTGALVLALYTGNMAAFLTVRHAQSEINGLEDLEARSDGTVAILCAVGKPNATEIFLRDKYPILYNRRVCVDSYIAMGTAVESGTAMAAFYEAPILEWLAKASNCNLKTVGQLFGLQEFGYVFPKGSELATPFSEAITETRASSNDELGEKYLRVSTACDAGSILDSAQLDERPFMGLLTFWVIVCGVFLLSHFMGTIKKMLCGRNASVRVQRSTESPVPGGRNSGFG